MRVPRTTPSSQTTPALRPADAEPAADPSAVSQAVPGAASGLRNLGPFRGLLALVSASLLLVAAGIVLLVLAGRAQAAASGNQAQTSAARTRQVTSAVSAGVAGIYSYSYTDLAATTRTAHQVLAGPAAAQYAELSRMLSAAVAQRITVVTKVTDVGVRSLTGDTATLLVFLQQSTTRDGKPAGSVPAQLQVTAHLVHGRWLITGITTR
jgi:Mce-associated membrane protein